MQRIADVVMWGIIIIVIFSLWFCAKVHAEDYFMPEADLYSSSVTKVVKAIYHIEGGRKASKPYGIFLHKCNWDNIAWCELACRQTVVNNIKRFKSQSKHKTYLEYLASRYAPIGAENDPTDLNRNWYPNLISKLGVK